MRKTRFMSLFFLALSGAFFFVPQFRQAFTSLVQIQRLETSRLPGSLDLPVSQLREWASTAEAQRDSQTLAFVALHHPDAKERVRLSDLATAMNPKLGWIYLSAISNSGDRKSAQTQSWARKLQEFEPDNALGYLQEAEYLRENNPLLKANVGSLKLEWDQRLQQTEWLAAMHKAYAAPRYDSYNVRRFDLERNFLREHNLATPVRLVFSMVSYPIPNLLNIRQYADLTVNKVGKDAEKAGRTREALDQYWFVAHFGERMQSGGTTLIEQLIASAVQKIAYTPLATLLRSTGQPEAAATLEYAAAELMRRSDALRGKDILALSSNLEWNALVVTILLGLVMVFSALTVISVLYVNGKRWFRVYVQGKTYATVTIAENYLPVLLFVFCVGLYISYYPYARNFQHYISAQGGMRDMESVIHNTIALPFLLPGQQLPLGNPFVPYVWYALGGFALVLVLTLAGRFMEKTDSGNVQPVSGG